MLGATAKRLQQADLVAQMHSRGAETCWVHIAGQLRYKASLGLGCGYLKRNWPLRRGFWTSWWPECNADMDIIKAALQPRLQMDRESLQNEQTRPVRGRRSRSRRLTIARCSHSPQRRTSRYWKPGKPVSQCYCLLIAGTLTHVQLLLVLCCSR